MDTIEKDAIRRAIDSYIPWCLPCLLEESIKKRAYVWYRPQGADNLIKIPACKNCLERERTKKLVHVIGPTKIDSEMEFLFNLVYDD